MKERRVKYIRIGFEFFDDLSKMTGDSGKWTMAGGVNLKLIVWLVGYFADQGELPADVIPTWVWPDPSWASVCILIYSDTFEVVKEGEHAPRIDPVTEHGHFVAAIEKEWGS